MVFLFLYRYSVLLSDRILFPSGAGFPDQSDHSFPTSTEAVTLLALGVPVVSSSATPTRETSTLVASPEYKIKTSFVNSPDTGKLTESVSDAAILPFFVLSAVTSFPFVKSLGKFDIFTEI